MTATEEKPAPIKKWLELVLFIPLKPEDIIERTVHSGGFGVEDFAAEIDSRGYPGILQLLASRYLEEDIRPLLEKVLVFDEQVGTILGDPKKYFKTTDDQEARDHAVRHFYEKINGGSPLHLIRAMMAYIEYGLGYYVTAIREGGFALNELEVEDFELHLELKTDKALQTMLAAELRKAKITVELLEKIRRGK